MRDDAKQHQFKNAAEQHILPAGDFSFWLRNARNSLLSDNGTDVACGECIACCSSYQFISIRPEEILTLNAIRRDLLVSAPGRPKGHVLLGYDKKGYCPMMQNNACSIYEHRPLTCRTYDCRMFSAAGMTTGYETTVRIFERVRQWEFSYPSNLDRAEHEAMKAAAKFIREHASCFPGGGIPRSSGQLAVLAIKVYKVFLKEDGEAMPEGCILSNAEIADAIVEACKRFDAGRGA